MNLNRNAREFYQLQIITAASTGDPIPAAGWEASFDGGTTWTAATVLTHDGADWSAWLLAGPAADPGDADAVLSRSISPLVRAVDSSELIVRSAPGVNVPRP